MFRVVGCITHLHDLRFVVLAGALCLFASFTAISMIARARESGGNMRVFWIVAAGIVAGCGIWGTHFVAMLAYRSGMPVAYDVRLTILSVVIAAGISTIGFWLALQPKCAALGGAVAGAAISAMHYVGMAALRAPAAESWDSAYVAVSVAIGISMTALMMHLAQRRIDMRGTVIAALLFTLAICGMHFTSMAALTLTPDPLKSIPDAVLDPNALAVAVAAVAALIVAMGLVGAMVDHHLAQRASSESARLRMHIMELENTKRELERTSENLSAALEAADSANTAKSQFMATMSHELRTPLNAVIGFSEMLAAETFGPLGDARYHDYVGDIRSSGMRLLSVISDILDVSCLDNGKTELDEENLDVGAVVAEAVSMIGEQARIAKVELTFAAEDGLPKVRADRRRVRQVLLNLLSNAIKFTPAAGQIRVCAFCEGPAVAIAVIDTGIGIAPEDIPKALERFGQIDGRLSRKYEGVGLGLPLSRQLLELHGGSLDIQSAPSRGTTVTMRFPAHRSVPLRNVA